MLHATYSRWKQQAVQGTPFLSIVVPVHNQAADILSAIDAIGIHVSKLGIDWELIVTDNSSRDRTVSVVESLDFANLYVLKATRNSGKGSAVRRGILAARGNYVLLCGAEDVTLIEQVRHFLHTLQNEGADVAVGFQDTSAGAASPHQLSSMRAIASHGLQIKSQGARSGFRMYTRRAAHHLHYAQVINTSSFDLEILYLALKVGYKIHEIPVSRVKADSSKLDTRQLLRDVFKIKLNDIQGVYNQRLNAHVNRGQANVLL